MTMVTPVRLLSSSRFAPLFWTQFLGGLNDNFFKQAMTLLVAYRISQRSGLDPATLTGLAGATFVLPFVIFSAFAGYLADSIDKARLARLLKVAEFVLMIGAAGALLSQSLLLLFAILFLLGVQAAFFGPVKYSLLPAHLAEQELVMGNALIEGATFLAILVGSLLGGVVLGLPGGLAIIGLSLVGLSAVGYVAARFIPAAPPLAQEADPAGRKLVGGTLALLREASSQRGLWLPILGISWFWTFGAVVLALVPPLSRDILGGSETTAGFLLAVFAVGIAAGSFGCARYLKGEISPLPVPCAALAMSAILILLAVLVAAMPTSSTQDATVLQVLARPGALSVIVTLFALSAACGFFAVPLYAMVQHDAPADRKGRMIGANNIVNSLMIVAGAVVLTLLSSVFRFTIPALALTLAAANLVAACIMLRLLSRLVLKALARTILRIVYRIEVRGLENFELAGERRIVIANHQSFLDGIVLAAFMPGDPIFAVDTQIAKRWWARPLLSLVDFAAVDPTKPMGLKSLAKAVESGRPLVIFPEGRLTVTGSLMKVYDGPGMVADRTRADIIPVRLDGLQHTPFTRLKGRVATHLAPRIRMSVLAPRPLRVDPAIKGRSRRKAAGAKLYDLMSETIFATTDIDRTLFCSLVGAAGINGRRATILEDTDFTPITYGRLLAGSFILGRRLKAVFAPGETAGILLPNSVGAVVTFFALQAIGRVPAMLNVSSGAEKMLSACRTANVKTVLSSRRFVERGKLGAVVAHMEREVRILYLEDLRERIGLADKAIGFLAALAPNLFHREGDPNDAAVILFTSGSEGNPKGVALSHRNIQANRHQVAARIAFNRRDVVFNALPMFHSFGLTVGTLLPVLAGIRTFLYPSPLHYRIIPELVYQTNATVFFGTDTYLRGYARMANPYDFHSVRIVGAGAERVSEETRRLWNDLFGLRILEGYGATETAPVIAFNTPMHFRAGTVGRLMPGIAHRLDPVPGIEAGGRLSVRGPNVMLGYMLERAPGQIQPAGEWYDTGDIVDIDADGFVRIKGRARRFAKIGGEMVPLGAIEDLASALSPSFKHAAIARPDPRKGEQVILVSEDPQMTRQGFMSFAVARGTPEIMLPREVMNLDALPLLGSGKTDYPAVEALAAKPALEAAE